MTYLIPGSSGIFRLSLLFLFFIPFDDLAGQDQIKPTYSSTFLSRDLSTGPQQSSTGNLKIIGVMVEFMPDTNRFTSGNGTFGPGSIPYLENPGTNIDALPHDQNYFEAHLEFSKNYFETVSDGKMDIDFIVLPEIYSLEKSMADYSPTGQNPDLSVMAEFVTDVWNLVTESGTLSTNYNQGDDIAFVIFHAGVGRDLELTGTNLDKTPQDLPSFYLNRDTLADFLNDPAFSGFPINNGNLLVDNSLIIPRTLTRAGEDAAGNRFVLPLSINGLLTAQLGSHLGLPDLFDTQTGRSGIGRFGLMDGAGIFSYNGLFPPEPSAWEKIYLGWASPFLVDYDTETSVSVPATSLRQERSIAQIPLSGDEYFLVENRHRDPGGNGITITVKKNDGTYAEHSFSNSDTEFINQQAGFDNLLEPGVVVNVSNYDFSLPGGFVSNSATENGELSLNGGMLIWHIDESIIRQNISSGGVNNNPDRRGVDLEEADGAQDIGRPTSVGLFQNEVNGSPFDFWWSGNTARVITQSDSVQLYNNRFGPDSTPDNHSNSGAPSYFELYDFSDNLPVAHFKIHPVNPFGDLYELWDSKVNLDITTASTPDDEYWSRYPLAAQPYPVNNEEWILLPGYDGIQFYHPASKTIANKLISTNLQQPLIDSKTGIFTVSENPKNQSGQITLSTYQFDGEKVINEEVVEVHSNSAFVSSFEENILDIDGSTDRVDLTDNNIIRSEKNIQFSERAGEYQSKIEEGSLILNFPGGMESFLISQQNENARLYTGLIQVQGKQSLFYLLQDGRLSLFLPDDDYQSQKTIHHSDFIDWPAFADFNRNGSPDILFIDYTENKLIAKNTSGAFLSSFPLSAPGNIRFTGTPLIADIDGDDTNEIIVAGYDNASMNIFAYNQKGETVNGFPLHVGGIDGNNIQPLHPLITGNKLIAVSHSGDLKVWEFKTLQNVQWRSKYGNQTNNKITGWIVSDETAPPHLSLLNSEETYNWPNPAKDETRIRYQTREPAEIHIKILTISGRVIGNYTFQSDGGVSEEIPIDTSGWASGGYYALVEAKASGVTERKLVKIAIAR